jgi:hypothetical protein
MFIVLCCLVLKLYLIALEPISIHLKSLRLNLYDFNIPTSFPPNSLANFVNLTQGAYNRASVSTLAFYSLGGLSLRAFGMTAEARRIVAFSCIIFSFSFSYCSSSYVMFCLLKYHSTCSRAKARSATRSATSGKTLSVRRSNQAWRSSHGVAASSATIACSPIVHAI